MSHDLLLNLDQTIPENLGSNQVISTLDHFIYLALEGVLNYTASFIDCHVANLLHAMGRDETRRHYSIDFDNITAHARLVQYFAKGADKLHQIKVAALDRIFVIDWLGKYVDIVKRLVLPAPKSGKIESRTTDIPRHILDVAAKHSFTVDEIYRARPMLNAVEPSFNMAIKFRELIMQKYYRFVYKEILNVTKKSGMAINHADLYQNTLLTTIKTINKYSANKGTLTKFIELWFPSAYTVKFDHLQNQSYILPASRRNKMGETSWVDKGMARSSIAFDLEDAMHVQASIDGQSEENDSQTVREQEALLHTVLNACVDDMHVAQFATYTGTPHTMQPPINPVSEVAYLLEGKLEMLNKSSQFGLDKPVPDITQASLVIFSGNIQTVIGKSGSSISTVSDPKNVESTDFGAYLDSIISEGSGRHIELPVDYNKKLLQQLGFVKEMPEYVEEPKIDMSRKIKIARRKRHEKVN